MESSDSPEINAAEAQASLEASSQSRQAISKAIRTPKYYATVLGLGAGLLVGTSTFMTAPDWRVGIYWAGALACAMILVTLVSWYRKATGVWVSGFSAPGRPRLVAVGFGLSILAALFLTSWLGSREIHWPAIPLGLAMVPLSIIADHLWNDAYQANQAK